MAGWKLRKDKTQAETAATEPETAVEPVTAEPMTAEGGAEIYSAPTTDEEAPMQWGTPVETEHAPSFDMETAGDLHFADEEGPLKLMDYSAPFTEDLLPLSAASAEPIIAAPPPVETPPAEMPTLATPSFDTSLAEPGEADGDFTSTLRMSREELASALAPPPPSGVPPVAPFVLDTPLVSPATEETPPRLVVRMGRLSAAFDLTKEVTIIGRPDSEMHYYPDVEIDMDDAVSRRHAEIIQRGATYSLVDTGSTNGTLLNGESLPAHEERLLTHGDRIRVGERTEIIFE
jgi:hypothetical protein